MSKKDHSCEASIYVEGAPPRPCIRVAKSMCEGCMSWLCGEHLPKENHDCASLDLDKKIAPALNRLTPDEIRTWLAQPSDWEVYR